MNPLSKIMGWNIKKECNRIKITPRELADRIGVTEQTMLNWIRGDRQVTAYGLYRCSQILGVSMETLMQGVKMENEMTAEMAKQIIRSPLHGNVREMIEAIETAVKDLGEDCTMAEIWEWADAQ